MTNIIYKCPLCGLRLTLGGKAYSCDNRHSFDVAKEGYVNLLLAHRKSSKEPGDSNNMIRSRQHFLNAGYYGFIAQGVASHVLSANKKRRGNVIDIGCGEGYYMDKLQAAFTAASTPLTQAGIDISKPAVRLAAKRRMNAKLAIASAYALPYFDGTFQIAISVFSPISAEETARVLGPDGKVIMVGPGPQHLRGLASVVYDQAVPHEANFAALDRSPDFRLAHSESLTRTITVRGEHILDLLKMTPYYWRTSPERQEYLSELDQLNTSLDFQVRIYEKV